MPVSRAHWNRRASGDQTIITVQDGELTHESVQELKRTFQTALRRNPDYHKITLIRRDGDCCDALLEIQGLVTSGIEGLMEPDKIVRAVRDYVSEVRLSMAKGDATDKGP
jgi:hypothetical protein